MVSLPLLLTISLEPIQHKPEPVEHIDLTRDRHEILPAPAPHEVRLPLDKPPVLRMPVETPLDAFHRRCNPRESGNSPCLPSHTAPGYPPDTPSRTTGWWGNDIRQCRWIRPHRNPQEPGYTPVRSNHTDPRFPTPYINHWLEGRW